MLFLIDMVATSIHNADKAKILPDFDFGSI